MERRQYYTTIVSSKAKRKVTAAPVPRFSSRPANPSPHFPTLKSASILVRGIPISQGSSTGGIYEMTNRKEESTGVRPRHVSSRGKHGTWRKKDTSAGKEGIVAPGHGEVVIAEKPVAPDGLPLWDLGRVISLCGRGC